jgi:TRAP-type mannitol/chloroaromatic compound transport system permease small subunit
MKIERSIQTLQAGIYPLCRFLTRLAAAVLFLMMVLTVCDVFMRKTFSKPILGTVELSEFMLVIVVFFALAYTELADGHVKVDFLMMHFGKRARAFVDAAVQFAGFILFGVITWATVDYAGKMRAIGEVSQDLWLPKYPFIYLVALGCALFSLALFTKSLASLVKR